jgi:hypothetical protein
MPVNPDFVDLLRALSEAEARFLIVGAYAVTFHSKPRATADLDVWVDPAPENAAIVYAALRRFGAPLAELSESDLSQADMVYQIGVPPRRVDIMTTLTGVTFAEAWKTRTEGKLGGLRVPFIGRDALVRNKRALGRPQDLADLGMLGEGSG